jgi:hypothetical protein
MVSPTTFKVYSRAYVGFAVNGDTVDSASHDQFPNCNWERIAIA